MICKYLSKASIASHLDKFLQGKYNGCYLKPLRIHIDCKQIKAICIWDSPKDIKSKECNWLNFKHSNNLADSRILVTTYLLNKVYIQHHLDNFNIGMGIL